MKNDYPKINFFLLVSILLFLFIPLFQNTFHLKKWVKPLKGAYVTEKDTSFKWPMWFNETYQKQKDLFFNQNFGLRNYYVMLHNQIDYTLFKKINAEHVVVGKAGIFFEDNYIDAYNGKNFVGKQKLEDLASKLKQAQEILKSNGVDLEILFIPGKASYFSEYIPDAYKVKRSTTNYEYLLSCAKKQNIDLIDFNAWFLQMKPTSVYDLYPSGGIHWSNYGATLAMDSLRKHIEKNTGMSMREFKITKVNISDNLQNPDNDIADALNLCKDVQPLAMPYPEYRWLEKPGEIKPQALFVGDSYFWNWYYQGYVNNLFANARFWYYNQTVYPEDQPVRDVKVLSFKEEVSRNAVVVLMATESNIHDIGWGFADQVIANFKKKELGSSEKEISVNLYWRKQVYLRYFANEIMHTPDWIASVTEKAKTKNVPVEAMIQMDADYLYETEYNTSEVLNYTEKAKVRIKKDEKWMMSILQKAKEKNIPVEEMLELDAKYVYDTEVKGIKK